jgi:hypothetical protein
MMKMHGVNNIKFVKYYCFQYQILVRNRISEEFRMVSIKGFKIPIQQDKLSTVGNHLLIYCTLHQDYTLVLKHASCGASYVDMAGKGYRYMWTPSTDFLSCCFQCLKLSTAGHVVINPLLAMTGKRCTVCALILHVIIKIS